MSFRPSAAPHAIPANEQRAGTRAIFAGLLALLAATAASPAGSPSPRTTPLPLQDPVRDKNFPLLVHLSRPEARALFGDDPALTGIARDLRARLTAAKDRCGELAACYVEAARWSDAERQAVSRALQIRCQAAAARCARVMGAVRESGTMIRFNGRDDPGLLAEAWLLQSGSLDRVLRVYGLGVAPRYAAIDAMGSEPTSPEFARRLRAAVEQILATKTSRRAFHEDALQFALALLAIDGRDEAGRYEPMHRGENRAALRSIRRVAWDRHDHTAILVPGQGPEEPGVRLSPVARARLAAAVERYRAGAAPLIIVSGGHVHPARTPYCEALEMKRTLVTEFAVPEQAILIDPHARHTTTNLRNAARLLYRYGAPMSRPMLVVTDAQQAAYIASEGFDERNRNETGVVPYRDKRRVSGTEVSVMPVVDALQVGFEDALDP